MAKPKPSHKTSPYYCGFLYKNVPWAYMHAEEVVRYWLKSSALDLEAASSLLKNKKYTHALFFGHLSLEKLFKACYVKKTGQHAPYTHDLIKLAREANLNLPKEHEEWLPEINTFNIRARYLDTKFQFFKKCTVAFTKAKFSKIEEIH